MQNQNTKLFQIVNLTDNVTIRLLIQLHTMVATYCHHSPYNLVEAECSYDGMFRCFQNLKSLKMFGQTLRGKQ